MKKTTRPLILSMTSLLLCITMLMGTTYAWFTESISSGVNRIISGNLDVELEYANAPDATYKSVENASDIFVAPAGEEKGLWEPGHAEVAYLKVINKGNLALKYSIQVAPSSETVGKNAEGKDIKLSEILKFAATEPASTAPAAFTRETAKASAAASSVKLTEYAKVGQLEANAVHYIALVVYMPETVGNEANYRGNDKPAIEFAVTLFATQTENEIDSFGKDYDNDAPLPKPIAKTELSTSVDVTNGEVTAEANMSGETAGATIPVGVKTEASQLKLTVEQMAETQSNVKLESNEVLTPVNVHMEGVAADNTVPMQIMLKEAAMKGLNAGNIKLYHVENGVTTAMTSIALDAQFTAHNQFKYDPATGNVVLNMATFSEVALVADTENKWAGKFDYTWYDASKTELTIANADQLAAFGAIVGGMKKVTERKDDGTYTYSEEVIQDSFSGKTVKLIADINLGDKESENNPDLIFYPIGYYNSTGSYEKTSGGSVTSSVSSFEGTFDGNGNTIANFYQNTWEMFGDYNDGYSGTPNHYKDAMGLFGYVLNGTVKNLTVSNFSSDGEFTPTGVIAAYADGNSTFENIAITNCNPRVYNTGNGGIIGIAGDTSAANDDHITLKNITVDNSNKISALWGSWDVACGGLVGMYRGNVDGSGNATGDTISFENCHVSAQIDVYNDVCANYQYYAYRYAGMIIGSVRHNTKNDDGKTIPNMTGISASGCTVNYGDWNDYYYCEFEKNTMASYSEDYQFSRVPHSELNFTDSNENGVVDADERASVTGCKHTHTAEENHQAIYLPFHQLFTGYSWGVSSIGLKEYSGIVTNLDITEGDQQESVEKFETKFTGDFLYRVGNQNTVSIGSLFAAKTGATINNSGVWVKVEKLDENMNVSGTFTANTTDWTKGTIKFSGTGVVKVTIQDYNFCKPTELILEVVDANNYESSSISSLGSGNVALLCDTKLNNNGALALQNASLYGNGFTIDVSAGKTTGESITANYLLYLNDATIDNVQVVGAVYTNFDVISSNSWNNPVILSVGNSTIANSYISNCASPVRLRSGNLNIINSTLKGGFFANLDIRGGNVVLDNVTTINQANLNDKSADGKEIVGLGVVVYYEGPSADTTITIKNNLTQYNYLENKQTSNSYANTLINEIFGNASKYQAALFTDANNREWANTGVVSLSEEFGKNVFDDEQDNNADFVGTDLSYNHPQMGTVKGYLYASNPKVLCESYTYTPNAQYEIVPKVHFDHKINEVVKTDDSETSCSSDPLTDSESIAFADGDSFEWNVNILKSSNKDITYTVWVDGVQYTDKILFSESGTHTVVFKYKDANNYRKNGDTVEQYTVEYQTSMVVIVTEKEAAAKNAEISFPLLESYGTTKVTVDGKTYIMPNLTGTNIPKYGDDLTFDASTRKYGSLKSDGRSTVDIYYPIIKTAISGNYMVYPVFGNKNGTLVQIQDYADGGAGAALTPYNASTQSMPTGLSVSRGYTVQWSTDKDTVGSGSMSYGNWTNGLLCMKYQSSSDDIANKVMSNYLSYYPNINLRTNDRNEQVTVVEYKYVDNKGDTYYYCVGYHIEERNSGYAFGKTVPEDSGGGFPCVTPDTLITLADGTQKRIDQVTYADKLLVWNFYTGKYDIAPASILMNHGADTVNVTTLNFADGTSINTINGHGFFDVATNEFVLIDEFNATDYVGHTFVKQNGDRYSTTELVSYSVEKQYTEVWSILTAEHYNCILEGMWTVTAAEVDNSPEWLMPYVIGEDMKYDAAAMKADIEKYGLYTYDDFAEYMTYEQFKALGLENFKVSVGKGYITWDEILYLISIHIPQ